MLRMICGPETLIKIVFCFLSTRLLLRFAKRFQKRFDSLLDTNAVACNDTVLVSGPFVRSIIAYTDKMFYLSGSGFFIESFGIAQFTHPERAIDEHFEILFSEYAPCRRPILKVGRDDRDKYEIRLDAFFFRKLGDKPIVLSDILASKSQTPSMHSANFITIEKVHPLPLCLKFLLKRLCERRLSRTA